VEKWNDKVEHEEKGGRTDKCQRLQEKDEHMEIVFVPILEKPTIVFLFVSCFFVASSFAILGFYFACHLFHPWLA